MWANSLSISDETSARTWNRKGPVANVLISGFSSGLGAAFHKHYDLTLPEGSHLYGIDRHLYRESTGGGAHGPSHAQWRTDLTKEEDIKDLRECTEKEPIHLVVHCAGIRGLVSSVEEQYPDDVARAETLENMDTETILRTIHINTVGTFNLIKALLPSLRLAASGQQQSKSGEASEPQQKPANLDNVNNGNKTNDHTDLDINGEPSSTNAHLYNKQRPKVLIMTSRMGSVSANVAGGGYAYRASKAALNAMVKSFVLDVPEVDFYLVHPGRVETGLTKCREEGAIEVGESVEDMLKLLDGGGLKSGDYVDRFGKKIEW